MFEVFVRRQAGAEIIERERAADFFHLLNEVSGIGQIFYGCGFGDLETDRARRYAKITELIDEKIEKGGVVEAVA